MSAMGRARRYGRAATANLQRALSAHRSRSYSSQRGAGSSPKRTHGPRCEFAIADLRYAGRELRQCGTFPTFIFPASLTQQLLARAALEFRRRRDFHQTGHSNWQIRAESKLYFRCTQPELERPGQRVNSLRLRQCLLGETLSPKRSLDALPKTCQF